MVTASKTTFVNWAFGQTQPGVPGKTLAVADGQVVDNINIVLPQGAVITGRIADEFGVDPVSNGRVTLMRQQFRRGQRTLTAGGSYTTNDIGEVQDIWSRAGSVRCQRPTADGRHRQRPGRLYAGCARGRRVA